MENHFANESKVLLDLLANSLFDAGKEIDFDGIDLESLFLEAKAQTVLALAFDALPAEARSRDVRIYDQWKFLAFSIIQKNIRQMHSNGELEKFFDAEGLPVCTIKGFASGYYYGDKKHLRQMGDIDFLVPAEKIETSKNLLIEKGYEFIEDEIEHDFHIAFHKNGELYEMHKGITLLSDGNAYIEKFVLDVLSGAEKKDFDEVLLTIPDSFSHGLIMLEHMKRHMLTGGGVGLRHLCDWAVFANSIENDEWVQVFEDRLKQVKLWKFAQALSKTASLYLKMEEKEWFKEAEDKISETLLDDMLSSGNFGKKNIKRIQELSFLAKPGTDKSKFAFYLNGIINKVYIWKPFYRNHRIFLPFGIVSYLFRIAYLTLFHKEKMNFFAIRKSGKDRNDLYHKLFQ